MTARDGSTHETWIIGKQERDAFALLAQATDGTFDFWRLAGPHAGRTRQAIASALNGSKVPISKAGVTMLREAFHAIARINERLGGECMAQRDDSFAAYANDILSEATR